jgi:hypothetical protein
MCILGLMGASEADVPILGGTAKLPLKEVRLAEYTFPSILGPLKMLNILRNVSSDISDHLRIPGKVYSAPWMVTQGCPVHPIDNPQTYRAPQVHLGNKIVSGSNSRIL